MRRLVRAGAGPDRVVHGSFFTRSTVLLPGLAPAIRHAALRALVRAGVTVRLGRSWCPQMDSDGDAVLRATGVEAPGWQRDPALRGALAVNDQGFVRADGQLRSVSHPQAFASGELTVCRPQPNFLALLATGDGRAIASRGPFSAEGAWTWRWKDHIDRRFLRQFGVSRPATATATAPAISQAFDSGADTPAPHH
jgi:NADH dehydrogenase FAD-containing subunit